MKIILPLIALMFASCASKLDLVQPEPVLNMKEPEKPQANIPLPRPRPRSLFQNIDELNVDE
jgi:hypothetical protein